MKLRYHIVAIRFKTVDLKITIAIFSMLKKYWVIILTAHIYKTTKVIA